MRLRDEARYIDQERVKEERRYQKHRRDLRPPGDENPRCCRNQYRSGEARQEGPSRNPRRSDPCVELRVNEMLNPESHHSEAKTASPEDALRAVPCAARARKDESASDHAQSHKAAGPSIAIFEMNGNSRRMNHHDEQEKHDSQESCCKPRLYFGDDAERRGHEGRANKIRPKEPAGDPCRHQSSHETRVQEMLNSENHQSYGDKNPAKHGYRV